MRIVNSKNETILIINDETFEIEKSNDPIFEVIWNDWLENGRPYLVPGQSPTGKPETDIIYDDERKFIPGPDTRGLVDSALMDFRLRLIE